MSLRNEDFINSLNFYRFFFTSFDHNFFLSSTHADPESCGGDSNVMAEVLTEGILADRAVSREMFVLFQSADAVSGGRQNCVNI